MRLDNYYYYIKDHNHALEIYNNITELNSTNTVLLTNKGNILRKLGRYEEAISCYNKSLEINPNYISASGNKGIALLEFWNFKVEQDENDKKTHFLYNVIDTKGRIRPHSDLNIVADNFRFIIKNLAPKLKL